MIKISGDPDSNRSATVRGTIAQGSNFASLGSGLTIGKLAHENIPLENCEKIGQFEIPPRVYVDDELILNRGVEAARENGKIISDSIEKVSLEANTESQQ